MRDAFKSVGRYGRELTVMSAECPAGRAVMGFIAPLDPADTKSLSRPARPGRVNDERYLLIVPRSAVIEGETALTCRCGGELYDVLRIDRVVVAGSVSHWEGVIRRKGGSA